MYIYIFPNKDKAKQRCTTEGNPQLRIIFVLHSIIHNCTLLPVTEMRLQKSKLIRVHEDKIRLLVWCIKLSFTSNSAFLTILSPLTTTRSLHSINKGQGRSVTNLCFLCRGQGSRGAAANSMPTDATGPEVLSFSDLSCCALVVHYSGGSTRVEMC